MTAYICTPVQKQLYTIFIIVTLSAIYLSLHSESARLSLELCTSPLIDLIWSVFDVL